MVSTLHDDLLAWLETGQPAAYAVIIETSGSTPLESGAQAAFLPDGRMVGSVGGGCLEAETRWRALRCLDTGRCETFELDLDDDFGWDDGMVCGGRVRVFTGPLVAEDASWLQRCIDLSSRGQAFAVATIVTAEDRDQVGKRTLLDGETVHHGEALADDWRRLAAQALAREGPFVTSVSIAGKPAEVFFLPHRPSPRLVIAGAGRIGRCVCHLASLVGFAVTVIDDRADFANRARLPEAENIIVGDIAAAVRELPLDAETSVVIVTRGHRHDAAALSACLGRPARYIGMLGSRRKTETVFRALLESGDADEAELTRVHAPIGLDIGALTAEEIAVSIVAELIAARRTDR